MLASTQMGIFCNTRLSVETLFEKLRARGASVCAMVSWDTDEVVFHVLKFSILR